jgi:hypothetical protein
MDTVQLTILGQQDRLDQQLLVLLDLQNQHPIHFHFGTLEASTIHHKQLPKMSSLNKGVEALNIYYYSKMHLQTLDHTITTQVHFINYCLHL